uniref:N-alpha-acetyltransferase 30 n=1 Tax=Rhinolophus ferrumequinum TaxID=59479 RepID=A0A671E0C9_RHIFE
AAWKGRGGAAVTGLADGPGGRGRGPAKQLGGAEEREGGAAELGGHLREGRFSFLPLLPPPPPPPARSPLCSALVGRVYGPPLSVCVALGWRRYRLGLAASSHHQHTPARRRPSPAVPSGGGRPRCCSEDEEDDEEHEGGGGGRRPAGGEATAAAKGHPCLRCPQPPQEQQQLNGLISPELRHLRAAASLKSKVLSAAEAATSTATPDGGPRATATKGAGVLSGESPSHCLPNNSRTALPSPAEAAAASDPAAARNGLAEGTEQEEEEDEQVRLLSSSLTAGCSLRSPSGREVEPGEDRTIRYVRYESELQMPDIMRLITKDLSEPYSIYTYRYFIHNWPQLCFLAMVGEECVGAIVCKLDMHKKMFRRGYIAMLAVDSKYRRSGIGTNLVKKAIYAMVEGDCDEVVLETEITNKSALKLYENLGFVRDKRLFRYYLNGVDALRLKLWLR